MSRDLKSIAIVDGSHEGAELLYDRNPAPAGGPWLLVDVPVDASHAGCLAYRGDV